MMKSSLKLLKNENLLNLARFLGNKQEALNELRWLSQSSKSNSDLQNMINDRIKGKPLQYILGNQPFGDVDIKVKAPILIPRPETEYWTTKLIESYKSVRDLKILDLCTGSGCIGILSAKILENSKVTAIDKSRIACELTELNARNNLTSEQLSRFKVMNIDLMTDNIEGEFDIITANPPYITKDEYESLDNSVKHWEDKDALVSEFGLEFYNKILCISRKLLFKSKIGILVMEVGFNKAKEIEKLINDDQRFNVVDKWKDPFDSRIDRVVIAKVINE